MSNTVPGERATFSSTLRSGALMRFNPGLFDIYMGEIEA